MTWPTWARALAGMILVAAVLLGLVALASWSIGDHWLQIHAAEEAKRPR